MNAKALLLTSHPIVFRGGGGGGGGVVRRRREMECQNGRKFEFLRKILKKKKTRCVQIAKFFRRGYRSNLYFYPKDCYVMDTLSSYNEVKTNPL